MPLLQYPAGYPKEAALDASASRDGIRLLCTAVAKNGYQ